MVLNTSIKSKKQKAKKYLIRFGLIKVILKNINENIRVVVPDAGNYENLLLVVMY
jgi:hypothetical protein